MKPRHCDASAFSIYHSQHMTPVLAIETSQRAGGVALRDRNGSVHVEMLAPKKRRDDDLLPAIDRAFRRAGCTSADLSEGAVGVSIGPGGFTGLRIAVTTAKMFAEILHTKLIGVPSALVAAQSTLGLNPGASDVIVCLACKNDSCWCTRVRFENQQWRTIGQPGLCTAKTLEISGISAVLADEHLPEPLRILCEQNNVVVVEPKFDPGACLLIAERMFRDGATSNPLTFTPLYPREPEAVTLWQKRLNRQGA